MMGTTIGLNYNNSRRRFLYGFHYFSTRKLLTKDQLLDRVYAMGYKHSLT